MSLRMSLDTVSGNQGRNIKLYCPVKICRDYLQVIDFLEHKLRLLLNLLQL
jgi:hypothetical protein